MGILDMSIYEPTYIWTRANQRAEDKT